MKAPSRSNPIARLALIVATAAILIGSTAAHAALVVNPAQPITQRVNVRIIRTAETSGANPAPLFGTPAETSAIFAMVDTIWAQAGIDIDFSAVPATTYNNTFALSGTAGNNNPRPSGDLNTIVTNAAATMGILDPNPLTLNLFMVDIVPGFSQTSDNTSNGLAFLDANGITFWAGPNLPSFLGGQEVIAGVLSHEIGHNLNLGHIVEAENLMQAGGSPNPGHRLNSAQITAALNSPFSVIIAVPESSRAIAAVMLLAAVGSWKQQLRRTRAH
jgi:hypothetical protein